MRLVLFGINDLGQRCLAWLRARGDTPARVITEPVEPVRADLGLSIGYTHILTPDQLARFPIVNLHTSYLPWNRGVYPNVWPLVDGTPAGVTLHWVDEGVDTGDIIAQQEVKVRPYDTAESLYHRLEDAGFDLFVKWWDRILDGTAPRTPQPKGGTRHKKKELATLDWLMPLTPDVERALNQLRARSFSGYPGVRYRVGDTVVEATVTLREVS